MVQYRHFKKVENGSPTEVEQVYHISIPYVSCSELRTAMEAACAMDLVL